MFQVSSRVLMSKLGSLPHSPSIGDTNSRSSSYKAGTISKFLWAVVPLDELRLATQFTLHVSLTVAIFPVSYLTMCEFARLHALATAELMMDCPSLIYIRAHMIIASSSLPVHVEATGAREEVVLGKLCVPQSLVLPQGCPASQGLSHSACQSKNHS